MAAARLTDDVYNTIVEYVSAGNYLETAAAAAGVDIRTVRRWIRDGADPESEYAVFRREVLRSEAEAEHKLVSFLQDCAAAGDPRPAQWWLERRHPAKWSLRIQHVVGEQFEAVISRIEQLEERIGREAVDLVLDALAGGDGEAAGDESAEADLH